MNPNEEHLAFYHQIGRAVTQWAHIEQGLYEIATICFGDREHLAVNVAFFGIENFRSKLQFVDNLVSVKYQKSPLFAEWEGLHRKIESAAKGRNTIVHYWVLIYPHERPGRRLCLLPRLPNLRKPPPKRRQKIPAGALCVRDVSLLVMRFGRLAVELEDFSRHLRGRSAPIPISPEPEERPMTLRELRHLIRVLSGHPQQSSRR